MFLGRSVILIGALQFCCTLIIDREKCPNVASIEMPKGIECDKNVYVWKLETLAHIPGGSHSMNIFHNPYGPPGCELFFFYCRSDLPSAFGDFHLLPKSDIQLTCPAVQFAETKDGWQIQIEHNPEENACQAMERWNNVDIFLYQQNEYIFMYSCKVHEEDVSTEMAAWILINVDINPKRRKEVLAKGLELFEDIPEINKNWWIFPKGTENCPTTANCSYYADCVTKNDVTEMKRDANEGSISSGYLVFAPAGFIAIVSIITGILKCKNNCIRNRVMPLSN